MGLHRYFNFVMIDDDERLAMCDWIEKNYKVDDYLSILFNESAIWDANWYEFEEDMQKLVTQFPSYTFVIQIEEGSGDIWRMYCWEGKTEAIYSKLVFESAPFEID